MEPNTTVTESVIVDLPVRTVYNQWTVFRSDFDPIAAGLTLVQSPVGDLDANDVLDVADKAVVLAVEHVVHRGQRDVLVDATVAGHEVRIEHLVVVGGAVTVIGEAGVGIGRLRHDRAGALGRIGHARNCVVRDVGEEHVPGAGGVCREQHAGAGVRGRVALEGGPVVEHDLREAVGPRQELAVEVGGQQRDGEDVGVYQLDAQQRRCLRLDVGPSRHAADRALDEAARGHRVTGTAELVLTQEDLVGGMRGVGLVLVDEG